MNGKFSKYLTYVFIGCLVLIFVLNKADESQTWAPIVKAICFYVAIACGLVYLSVIVLSIIENKKIDKMLNADDFDSIIVFANNKLNKSHSFFANRSHYYEYLLLLSYLGKDDIENANIYFDKLKGQEIMFPMISYWRVCHKFSINEYDNLEEDYNIFKNSREVARASHKYSNLLELLNAFILYSKGNIKESKNIISTLNTDNVSMPATLRSIKIVNDTVINEEENAAE